MQITEAKETVLVIPDLHYPFAHRDHLGFLEEVAAKYDPTAIIGIGDELDFHALSDYDHDPDGDSPGAEFKKGLADLQRLYSIFPRVSACISNHTARPYRRAFKFGIPKVFLRSYAEFLEAPEGWSWALKHEIDGVRYEHGEGLSGKFGHLRGAEQNMQSTVIGHIHSHAGIAYVSNPRQLFFGFNVGCLIDKDAYSMAYATHMKSKPILGAGVVVRGVPTFIPMLLRKGGRWVGHL